MSANAVRWRCAQCGVSVGRMDGQPTTFPESWSRSDEGTLCLGCSRAQAGERAMESAPAGCSRQDRVRRRRRALIEFELGRAPEATDRAVALACRTSAAAVAGVRAGRE